MKKNIHPVYYQAKVTCACGHAFVTGSTLPEIHVDICSACHPFFTGSQRFVDTQGRVEKFMKKREETKVYKSSKKAKQVLAEKKEPPKSLREMLQSVKS